MPLTEHILLVKPASFFFNEQTAGSNTFQNQATESQKETAEQAAREFDRFAETLRQNDVEVIVAEDTHFPFKPDAVFPNNWVSFHRDGTVVLYPMFAPNRRLEKRPEIIDQLRKDFEVSRIIDLSHYEQQEKFLEGTGSIVFDHHNQIAYACISPRTNQELFVEVCELLRNKPVYFHAYDTAGKEIYHTNVMMCTGRDFAVICLESITNEKERKMVRDLLENTGHQIVEISYAQMNSFAGNMLAVKNKKLQSLLVMSQSAFDSLTEAQKEQLEKSCKLLPIPIKLIETIGGGSARCMIAEVFLPLKGNR